jgi:hypothetical protein
MTTFPTLRPTEIYNDHEHSDKNLQDDDDVYNIGFVIGMAVGSVCFTCISGALCCFFANREISVTDNYNSFA